MVQFAILISALFLVRHYYRCTSCTTHACPAKRRVTWSSDNTPTIVVIGEHEHSEDIAKRGLGTVSISSALLSNVVFNLRCTVQPFGGDVVASKKQRIGSSIEEQEGIPCVADLREFVSSHVNASAVLFWLSKH
jgi:hypothetical protein